MPTYNVTIVSDQDVEATVEVTARDVEHALALVRDALGDVTFKRVNLTDNPHGANLLPGSPPDEPDSKLRRAWRRMILPE